MPFALLRSSPGFAAAGIFSLALGIAENSTREGLLDVMRKRHTYAATSISFSITGSP